MMRLTYVEHRNGVQVGKKMTIAEVNIKFSTDEINQLILGEMAVAENAADELAAWTGNEPLTVTFSTRSRYTGTWAFEN